MNCSSLLEDNPVCFTTPNLPIYYSTRPSLIEGIPDYALAAAAPVITYWTLSLFFHALDVASWKWADKYRIHESEEARSRNLVTKREVVWTVLFQQFLQTVPGLPFLAQYAELPANHPQELRRLAVIIERVLSTVSCAPMQPTALAELTNFVYWWGIPMFKLLVAVLIIDIWQYTVHRLFHVNQFLYRNFHSWHHRLQAPYAFGALYGHPIEGVVLDSGGAVLAQWATGMTTRQAMLLFIISTLKVVDDHSGYHLPWDPLQMISGNNASYHDIHHQSAGIKFNYSQPFFLHLDTILGTRMTHEEFTRRRQKGAKSKNK